MEKVVLKHYMRTKYDETGLLIKIKTEVLKILYKCIIII